MTNTLALVLAFLLIVGVAADVVLNGSEGLIFLGRRMVALIEDLAVWR